MSFPYPPKPWQDGQTVRHELDDGVVLIGVYEAERNIWHFTRSTVSGGSGVVTTADVFTLNARPQVVNNPFSLTDEPGTVVNQQEANWWLLEDLDKRARKAIVSRTEPKEHPLYTTSKKKLIEGDLWVDTSQDILFWYDGGDTSSPGVRIIMTPDYKHSQADIIKNKLSMRYCKTNIGRNPILGYRKQLECDLKITYSICPKNPTNDIYKDNYAKTCGKFRKNGTANLANSGYSNVILPKQNNKGIVDASYNYSTSQYLSRPNFMKCNNVYKKSNPQFSTQGAVSGGSRLNRLKYQTMVKSQQKFNILANTFYKFRFKVGYWQPTSQLKLYGYGNGTGIPGSLNPDNLKGNVIATLNITENSFLNTYGLQVYFTKKIEDQFNENILKHFKFILNFNDLNIQINYSDLTQFYNYGSQFEYDFDYKSTHPNYNLIKNLISNGGIVGKTINMMIILNKLNVETIFNKKKMINMVNGVYPSTLYRNTRPIHKSIHSTNFKCKGRSCNGLLQFCANSK